MLSTVADSYVTNLPTFFVMMSNRDGRLCATLWYNIGGCTVQNMEYGYNDENLRPHGVNRSEVEEVLDVDNTMARDFDMLLSRYGRLRTMFVGYNLSARLLEIGVEFIDENKAYVFHGQTVSPLYRKLYEERITNE